jgi:phosphoribosyl 1,2-cyclic phosphate phosphodiesterase
MGGKTFLIDVGPDFREQALKFKIEHLDGLIMTHTHYDHIAGIGDLRALQFRTKKLMPCLLSEESHQDIQRCYHYLCSQFQFQIVQPHSQFEGVQIKTCSYFQAGMKVTGYRFGDFAYITDIRDFGPEMFEFLRLVRILVLSALHEEASKAHLTIDEAVAFSEKIGAEKTWLTHISHKIDHEATERMLPASIRMGYDGLTIKF